MVKSVPVATRFAHFHNLLITRNNKVLFINLFGNIFHDLFMTFKNSVALFMPFKKGGETSAERERKKNLAKILQQELII